MDDMKDDLDFTHLKTFLAVVERHGFKVLSAQK